MLLGGCAYHQDIAFITFNRLVTIPFLYVVLRYAATSPMVPLPLDRLTFVNTIGALVLMFAIYDFVYWIMHRVMHIRVLYPLVHKHHHRQHVRGCRFP